MREGNVFDMLFSSRCTTEAPSTATVPLPSANAGTSYLGIQYEHRTETTLHGAQNQIAEKIFK